MYHDTVVSGDDTKTADEIFGGETVEFYVYDQHWRVTSVWRAGPKVSGTRPDAYCYERFIYSSAGLNGRGDAWLLDCPVMSEICTSGDGVTFDRVRRYLQNARGDVVGVQEAAPHTPDLSVRYSVYGFPEVVFDRDPYHTADFDGDGDVGTSSDITAFFQCLANNCCPTCDSIDVNRDGSFGTDADIDAFFAVISGDTVAPQADLKDLRFGFRGYWWDDHLKLYHVRNRVYDPAGFRWLQPDPAGYVDGLNLYAYCGGDPINGIDPYGLDEHLTGYLLRKIGADTLADWTDDFDDGADAAVDYWSSAPSPKQAFDDASDPEARGEVHDALHTARDAAGTAGPPGKLAGSAVDVVDRMLTIVEVFCWANNQPVATGPVQPLTPQQFKALVDFTLSLADGVNSADNPGASDSKPDQSDDSINGRKRAHDAARDVYAKQQRAAGKEVQTEVVFEAPDGTRARVDTVTYDPETGEFEFSDHKLQRPDGTTAEFSPNQKKVYKSIAEGTARPVGPNAETIGLDPKLPAPKQPVVVKPYTLPPKSTCKP